MARILVVDDEEGVVWSLSEFLGARGHAVRGAATAERAVEEAKSRAPDVVIMDLRLPGMDGLSGIERVRAIVPGARFLLMSAHGTLDAVVRGSRIGVVEYLAKPVSPDELARAVERALVTPPLPAAVREALAELEGAQPMAGFVGRSPKLAEAYRRAAAAAPSDATVLLTGETGTGKELLARAIHNLGARAARPFEPINCASIPETLIESELYGHEAGAFTGAVREKPGKLEIAAGGTVFLDEVGDLSPGAQAKLLRFLEDRTFERVGGVERRSVDARILAATNRDLDERVAGGRFRADLLFRLRVVTIALPPLRDRREDLALLTAHFLRASGAAGVSEAAYAHFERHPWPGNVRELKNAIEHGAVLARGGVIDVAHLPESVRRPWSGGSIEDRIRDLLESHYPGVKGNAYRALVESLEKAALDLAMREAGGNLTQAAKDLGLTRVTLRKKLRERGLRSGD